MKWDQGGPDCETCLGELLLPGNQDAFRVYQSTRTQLILSMGGAVSINQMAIWEYLDRYNIANKIDVFEQVCMVSQEIISDQNEVSRLEQEANKVK